jgi:hypothetical protein
MRRWIRVWIITAVSFIAGTFSGCGSSGRGATNFPVPASLTLTPSTLVSLDVGSIQTFTASALNAHVPPMTVTTPVTFASSNTAIVTIANNGLACAGTWDSLTNPQICTPGAVGSANITAVAQGVSSPPTTVYVHQHVDNIVVGPAPTNPPSSAPCVSKGLTTNYQATAFSRGVDITGTVGPFSWSALSTAIVAVSTTATGLQPGQVQVTGNVPGVTQIFASAGNSNSAPTNVITCPVQSIALAVSGGNTHSFTVNSGTGKDITATVIDSQGATITGVPLTWTSLSSATAGVGSSGNVTTTQPGGSAIVATCTPPTCNVGFTPQTIAQIFPGVTASSLPIYPTNPITAIVNRSGTTPSGTVYVASTGCGTMTGCVSTVVPISFPANVEATATALPNTPNSLKFGAGGSLAFLGTANGFFGSHGLTVFNPTTTPPTATEFNSVVGKVLAVSPNASKVVLSDTTSNPNEVYIFDSGNNSNVHFQITGATAADFSPDSLKAFIVAGSTLYVYSQTDPLQTIPLTTTANDVSFLTEGAFGYLAGGEANAVTVRRTCDLALATDSGGIPQIVTTPGNPLLIRSLPDSGTVVAVDPPLVDVIKVSTSPTGCQPPVSDTVSSFNLGQGNFTPTQLLIAPDGSRAFIVTSNLGSILVFDVASGTSTAIPLAGNTTALSASLTPEGTLMYVGAADGLIHVLDTSLNSDVAQISLVQDLCLNVSFKCMPDLVAVRP